METKKYNGRPQWVEDLCPNAVCNHLGCTIEELDEKLANDFEMVKFGYSPLFLESRCIHRMQERFTELMLPMRGKIKSNTNKFIPILHAGAYAASYEIDLPELVHIGFPIVRIGSDWFIDEGDLEAIICIANEISYKHNNPKKQPPDKLISSAKAMYLLKCGPVTLDVLLTTGLLRMRSYKGKIVFYKSDIMNFISEDYEN